MRDGGRGNMRLDVVDSPGVGNKAIFVTGAVAGSKIIPVGWVLLSSPHPPYNLSELLLILKKINGATSRLFFFQTFTFHLSPTFPQYPSFQPVLTHLHPLHPTLHSS